MQFSQEFLERIYRTGFFLAILLILVDLLTFFYYPETIWGDIFLATREQTPLTWISALAFFFIALSCLSVYLETKKRVWYLLAATFFFFSVDDATYLHERISGFFADNTTVFAFFPSYIWVLIYFPLLAFSLGAFVWFLWRDADARTKKRIMWAVVALGGALFLDLLEGFVSQDAVLVFCTNVECHNAVTHLLRLSEEMLEIVALGVLGYLNLQKHCVKKEQPVD